MPASKELTPAQVEIIKACVPALAEHGKTITTLFYKNILNDNKALNGVFNQTHQVTGHQAQALACAVFAYAKYIDNLAALAGAVELICQKHASLHIQEEHYGVVGTYLLAAIKEVLGEAATPEVLETWGVAYWNLANIFIAREKQLYDESNGWKDWRDFIVDKKVKESHEVTSFYLKPKDGKALPSYKPGQYISVQTAVPHFEWVQSRQYSLSAASNTTYYRISVKREEGLDINDPNAKKNPGWVSNVLHATVKEGDTLQVSHPRGAFFLDTKASPSSPVVLLSAGVGVTPLLSILETLSSEKSKRKVSWVHSTRSKHVQPFGKLVQDLVKTLDNAHATVFNKNPKDTNLETQEGDYQHEGRLDLDKVNKEKDLFLNDKDAEYYVCGPTVFMSDVNKKLQALGVDEKRIKYEVFGTGGLPQ